MYRKILLICLTLGFLVLGAVLLNPFKSKTSLSNPELNQLKLAAPITPSQTLKTYTDPTGFSFNYPDNLSLLNNELKDTNSYAELQLAATGIDGSLTLKITDSKLASLDELAKTYKDNELSEKEVKLGNLKALEITTKDKILLGALDQGVLFNIEVPQGSSKDFWAQVYSKVLADFTFTQPEATNPQVGSNSAADVSFEGEEVVE